MANAETAGQLIQRLREQRGWTRSELAQRSKVSTTAITNYERGYRWNNEPFTPNISKVMQVAAPFGSQDATRILRAYGFEKQADQVEQDPASLAPETKPVMLNGGIAPGTMFEAIGPVEGKTGQYVFRDDSGKVRIFSVI
jgi:transcriptional regulator with XRE-family HTH domain